MALPDRPAGDPAPGFPLRVGVADVGSNAIRLIAAEFIAPTTYTELVSERLPVRLGHGVYRTGRLDPDAVEGAVRALSRFRDVLDELGIERYRAVATSAVRESEDGRALIRRVRDECGIKLEVVSGVEEIRLVYWAARDRLGIEDEPWILADLGGGSLEVALANGEGLIDAESHSIGSVRLYEELENASGKMKRFRRLLDEYLEALRILAFDRPVEVEGFAATGGNMEDLAALAGAVTDERGVAIVPLDDLDDLIAQLSKMSVEERIEELGLRPDRADVVLPAGLVYARLARMAGVDEIHVPRVGVKEGVMFDLVQRLSSRAGYGERHARDTRAGAVALGRRFGFEEEHGIHVARLSERLFDALEPIHELEAEDRELLVAAAVLHDVGQRISYNRHHKHSEYLISNSELPGFSPHEVGLVAQIARYHRKADPSPRHEPFAALDEEDQDRVTRLAAILRLADALDREHHQRVERVEVRIEDDEVGLGLVGDGDLALERWALERKAGLFEETFDLAVTVDEEDE
ncbi:MAG TPA: Ppx/GppA phosphatase family protein [Gemmatimonadota bacterium]|nr:Ppx/GppA phosphatase family protein [Gemmatimonadota bacterium]